MVRTRGVVCSASTKPYGDVCLLDFKSWLERAAGSRASPRC